MDANQRITKRLHISGLTPALTATDISQRLSSFGTVKATDGFGLLDGVGRPRKFGYVTLETTNSQLARCLNLLSGSTWKGAKLRIGEAKPDYAQRLAKERQDADPDSSEPPRKRQKQSHSRSRFSARHANDMSLVTAENAHHRSSWKVTPLGRIIQPMRMRPLRPLPPISHAATQVNPKTGKDEKKKRKRERSPDNRARRRTIDMTKWGSVQLKGMFMEVGVSREREPSAEKREIASTTTKRVLKKDAGAAKANKSHHSEDVAMTEDSDEDATEEPLPTVAVPIPSSSQPAIAKQQSKPIRTSQATGGSTGEIDLVEEKKATLGFLASIFGDKDEDWVGKESVGSDIDEEELLKGQQLQTSQDEEEDTSAVDDSSEKSDDELQSSKPGPEADVDMEEDEPEAEEDQSSAPATTIQAQNQPAKLKDLFAPKDDNAGFSLLGHLDLDLELDDELLPFSIQPDTSGAGIGNVDNADTATTYYSTDKPSQIQSQPELQTRANQPGYTAVHIDPKQALFFPSSITATATTTLPPSKNHPKTIIDALKDHGWHWRDENLGFWRTESEEEIKQRWEANKRELTVEWKKRWKEASKIGKRRRGRGKFDGGGGLADVGPRFDEG